MPDPRRKPEEGKLEGSAKGFGPKEEDVLVEPYFGPAYVYNSQTRKRTSGKSFWDNRHPESNA